MNNNDFSDGLFDTDVNGASWQAPPEPSETKKPPKLLYAIIAIVVLAIISLLFVQRFSQTTNPQVEVTPTPTITPTPKFSEVGNELNELKELIEKANPERQDLPPPVDMKLRFN